jgi:hypothetical protein
MLIGKCVFNAEDLDSLVEKVEKGTYTVPTKLSKEVISFLNGMLQYDGNMRLNIDQLAKHSFLTKNVKDFHSIDIKKVSKNVDKSTLKINVKQNKSIWAIFNKDDEDRLLRISAQDFDKPINEENIVDTKNNNKNNNVNINKNNLPHNNTLNNNKNNNLQHNNTLNNNKNNIPMNRQKSGNMPPNNQSNNNIQKVKSASIPVANYPIGYVPQGMVGYPAMRPMQAIPMQGGMIGMPVMAYPQMQQVPVYGMQNPYMQGGYYK